MAQDIRLDLPNPSSWIYRAFAKRLDAPNGADMPVDIETVRHALTEVMERKGIKPTTLSLMVGKNKSLVKDLFDRQSDVSIGTLVRLAGALDVSVLSLLEAPRVPVVGYIGAGGSIVFEDLGCDDTVVRPPNVSHKLVALVVRGDSMLPKYQDGDIIYIARDHDGVLPDYMGRDCAVRLTSGETFIKQIIPGGEEGRFTLLSLNAGPMENMEVEWATPVAFIMPSHSRYLLD